MENSFNTQTKQKVYNTFRSDGYNQKESGQFAGVNEKTAGVYEKKRREYIDQQITENDELIEFLKKKSEDPKYSPDDLVSLIGKLQELFKRREYLKRLI